MNFLEGDFIETKEGLIFDVKGNIHPNKYVIAYVRYIPLDLFLEKMASFLEESINQIPNTKNSQFISWKLGFDNFLNELPNLIENNDFEKIKNQINSIFNFKIESVRFRSYLNDNNNNNKNNNKNNNNNNNNNKNDLNIYLKVYDINSRFEILTFIAPEYIYCPPNYDFPLQGVPKEKIIRHYQPEIILKNLLEQAEKLKENHNHNLVLKNDNKYNTENLQNKTFSLNNKNKNFNFSKYLYTLQNLVDFLLNVDGVTLNNLGISGSVMVGLLSDRSDYDLIVYGQKESISLYNFLIKNLHCKNEFKLNNKISKISDIKELKSATSKPRAIRYKNNIIKCYNYEKLKEHYKFRAKGFDVSLKDFCKYEMRKSHQFLIDDIDVFLRYILVGRYEMPIHKDSLTLSYPFEDVFYRNLGRIKAEIKVIDDHLSIFTPSIYLIKIKHIISVEFINSLEENENAKLKCIKYLKKHQIFIFSYRGRFTEQARKGEEAIVDGKLEISLLRPKKENQQEIININQLNLSSISSYEFRIILGISPYDKFILKEI
ncbi:MAG: hypothetical protein ACTSRZ_01170 [Promethearchaeota archaeon]